MPSGNALPKPLKIASLENLRRVWKTSRDAHRRDGGEGVDGIKPRKFEEDLSRNLNDIHWALIAGEYHFRKLRPIPIPKSGGGERIICVPTVGDRLVQRLIVDHLVDGDKLGIKNSVSFGFVRGRGGVPEAVKTAARLRCGFPWALKSDITAFFDRIDRKSLQSSLAKRLRNSSSLPIINAVIECEIDDGEKAIARSIEEAGIQKGKGLRQGMPLSPILSNFVLKDFDRSLERRGAKLIRYADDFVILAQSQAECEKFFPIARDLLAKVGHNILPPGEKKTAIYSPEQPLNFLGLEIAKRTASARYDILVPKEAFDAIKTKLARFHDFDYVFKEYKNLSRAISKLRSITSGFVNVYKPAKNASFRSLASHAGNCRAEAMRCLLVALFGADLIEQLDVKRKSFLEFAELLNPAHSA